jgi:hypothetical protein
LESIDEKIKAVKRDASALDKKLSKLPDAPKVCSPATKKQGEKVKKEKAPPKPAIKYPIEDLDINDLKDPYMPNWMDEESSARMCKLLTVSDNLILIGTRSLGIKAPSLDELNRIIHEASDMESTGEYIERDSAADSIHQLYHSIIEFLLHDNISTGKAPSAEKRWYRVISEGTWPEILRRFVLSRDTDARAVYDRPDSHATLAVSMLNYDPIESLTFDQHVSILYFLVNDVLMNSNAVRDLLQSTYSRSAICA